MRRASRFIVLLALVGLVAAGAAHAEPVKRSSARKLLTSILPIDLPFLQGAAPATAPRAASVAQARPSDGGPDSWQWWDGGNSGRSWQDDWSWRRGGGGWWGRDPWDRRH